ncbi:adenine-specific DNA methyltransferase [mine drainage metagenome]|uniref:site-specific DNA-methyltransferase (adenine-specific) n=1 Tax=mine drainage metagenome TaxID=410659 RepID=T1AU99_9ZZZZ
MIGTDRSRGTTLEPATVALNQLARPFLKWAGGKAQVYPALQRYFPPVAEVETYLEPFLGGGAVFFAYRPATAILADLNSALIVTYKTVKSNVDGVISELDAPSAQVTEEGYRDARVRFNKLLSRVSKLGAKQRTEFASLFIWINHTCFNGLFRVNTKGKFNVPFGYYQRPTIYSEVSLRAASEALREASAALVSYDYERVLGGADKGDFAYLDPPYDPVSDTAKFTSYTRGGFDLEEQERLARVVHDAVGRGCRVVLSNSPSERIRKLYGDFRQEVVRVPRSINCQGTGRSPVEELVVIA